MRTRTLLGALLALSVAMPATAGATGLVHSGEGTGLMGLQSLEVGIALTDDAATVTEVRSYGFSFAGPVSDAAIELRVFRTIPGGNAGSLPVVSIAGQSVGGELLTGAEADAQRKLLAIQLWDPAPLKHMGEPLFVSDALSEADFGAFGASNIPVEISVEVPLRARGTLRGVTVPIDWTRATTGNVTVNVTASTHDQLRALYSPYHPLTVTRTGAREATGQFSAWSQTTAFDIDVLLSTGTDPIQLDLLPFRYDDAEGGHFMALITPDSEPGELEVAPRDIAIVLDRSGSMSGEKMSQARTALKEVLDGLTPTDNFALVDFATDVKTLNDTAVLADAGAVSEAKGYVDELTADGGTALHDGLKKGFQSLPLNQGNPRYVVMLTDGIPTEGETDTEAILEMARTVNEIGARVVIFGIGDDVNTVLLEKLANETGGDAIYIRPGTSITEVVGEFFAQLQSPVLADPALDLSAFGADALYPEKLPDLFAGQTTAVFGRFAKPGDAKAIIHGVRGGETEEHSFEVTLPSFSVREGYVPKVWATRHIGTLLHRIKLEGKDPALVAEALSTARRYGIVTEFTYYAVDEDGDSKMSYSEVPMDSVGDKAVSTSAALDEMEDGDSMVSTGPVSDARWWRDRVLPWREGYFTDTFPTQTPEWIDLHFASEAYFDRVDAEADLGIGAPLAVAKNLRFEFMGRTFRITDPSDPPEAGIPDESAEVPAPMATPADVFVRAQYEGVTTDPTHPDGDPTHPDADPEDPPITGTGAGCTAATGTPSTGWVGLAALFALLLAAIRRRAMAL